MEPRKMESLVDACRLSGTDVLIDSVDKVKVWVRERDPRHTCLVLNWPKNEPILGNAITIDDEGRDPTAVFQEAMRLRAHGIAIVCRGQPAH